VSESEGEWGRVGERRRIVEERKRCQDDVDRVTYADPLRLCPAEPEGAGD
jgi:hypothetical protein